jgi:hypothetical protein
MTPALTQLSVLFDPQTPAAQDRAEAMVLDAVAGRRIVPNPVALLGATSQELPSGVRVVIQYDHSTGRHIGRCEVLCEARG